LYVRYADSQGMLYAKHLRRGDLRMLRFIARDVRNGLIGLAARVIRGRPRWSDERQGLLRGLIGGLVTGWRVFREDQAPPPSDSDH
jgi:hypothetical protein